MSDRSEPDHDVVDRGYVLHGRVQGVGFRWWTRRQAEQLGVVGTVENLRDGSVRVVARARADVLTRFEHVLGEGPPVARVDRVEQVSAALAPGASEFTILTA
jgi:acylphosphatase